MIKRLIKKLKRRKYVKAMMWAIEISRSPIFLKVMANPHLASKTNGLRAIKDFESVNNIKFDPFSKHHLFIISGMGFNKEFISELDKAIKI